MTSESSLSVVVFVFWLSFLIIIAFAANEKKGTNVEEKFAANEKKGNKQEKVRENKQTNLLKIQQTTI